MQPLNGTPFLAQLQRLRPRVAALGTGELAEAERTMRPIAPARRGVAPRDSSALMEIRRGVHARRPAARGQSAASRSPR